MSDQEEIFDGARLIRFAESLNASVEELRSLPPGSISVAELEAIVRRALDEADDVIPAPLLPELHSLVAPMHHPETERDLRVVLAEIAGWVHGLLGGMGITFAVAVPREQE